MAMDTNEPPKKASLPAQDVYRFHPDDLAEWLRTKLKEGNDDGQKYAS
jgi:hypothetical protein